VPVAIGLMGFGRIGRNIFRIVSGRKDVEVTAISDIAEPAALEYLLRFDTVHGRFPEPVAIKDGRLSLRGRSIPVVQGRDPGDVDWRSHGVEIVVEATAHSRPRADLARHLETGARRVVLCAPPLDEPDITVVIGVNEDRLEPSHRIISNASCTANCLGPIANVIHREFGILQGFASTVHAYTNAQRLADVPGGDMRRSRAAAENIIPGDTRAHEMLMRLIPDLRGRLGGVAVNVPVPDGSVVDFVAQLGRRVSREEVNDSIRRAAESSLAGIVEYETEPIVSSDVIGNPHSAVFDSLGTQVIGGDLVKILAWFDNGWGYASRAVDLVSRLARLGDPPQGPR
jgi:glyceraldehyde 3-phosphate dehydrogenase